ncbi:putative amidophosphoribosyltransferase [Rhizobium skierniewicense]|uniref:Putative amidophosphoribosyltransferase n=1 Tax=Rhizobium skierniewicense TaxID=984260 RepID=A0A7W6G2V7_9HYPH|nr:hypothetical protein [Rhizobium skierniewicense]MBB3947210.1 putative amidophosphoribosyltransferase [Rhizobium skierniewicense]
MLANRTRCINPCCKRTAPADKYPGEMICGKCFKALPQAVKDSHRFFWKQIRKWERRITKTSDELKLIRMRNIGRTWSDRLIAHWDAEIKVRVMNAEKPAGLDSFLEELGL